MVCRSLCLPVSLSRPWAFKSCWTDCDAVRHVNSGGPKEQCIRWGSRYPYMKKQLWGQKGAGPGHSGTCQVVDILKMTQQGTTPVWCNCQLGALDGECDWTVHVRRQCGLVSNCFDRLFLVIVGLVVSVQSVAWKYSSLKWPVMCQVGHCLKLDIACNLTKYCPVFKIISLADLAVNLCYSRLRFDRVAAMSFLSSRFGTQCHRVMQMSWCHLMWDWIFVM